MYPDTDMHMPLQEKWLIDCINAHLHSWLLLCAHTASGEENGTPGHLYRKSINICLLY